MAALTPCFGCSLCESVPNKAIYLLPLKDSTFGGVLTLMALLSYKDKRTV